MIYTYKYLPRVNDYNKNGVLSLSSMINILEDAAGRHSDSVNDNIIDGGLSGISWILVEWYIEILRRPTSSEEIVLSTWAKGTAPAAQTLRDYLIEDTEGEPLVKATAKFALFDIKANRLTKITKELYDRYKPEDTDLIPKYPKRLLAPKENLYSKDIQIRKTDIDYNNHVHNTTYLDYALEILPEEIFEEDNFSSIQIAYKTPVMPDDKISGNYHADNNKHTVSIYNQDNKLNTIIQFIAD